MRKGSIAFVLLLTGAVMAPVSVQGQAPAPAPSAPAPASPTTDSPAPRTRPRVRVVATGGTISNRPGGRLQAGELLASVPGLSDVANVHAEQFANTYSSQLTLDQWLALSRHLNDLFGSDRELAGVVVTSGTDTLEELAYFLHLTVRDRRPVVVTGSMRSPGQPGYEGPANLLAAVRVASETSSAGRGVLVVLNDEINGARDVTKSDAWRLHTFVSRSFGSLGVVDGDRVVFRRTAEGRHTASSEFDVAQVAALPRVDVFLVYQGAPGDVIRSAVDLGARGLVIATAGAGATSGTQDEGLEYARERGIPVVITTRTGSGRITPPGEPAVPDGAGRIFAGDLSSVKARVLLMLALTRTTRAADVQRIFNEY